MWKKGQTLIGYNKRATRVSYIDFNDCDPDFPDRDTLLTKWSGQKGSVVSRWSNHFSNGSSFQWTRIYCAFNKRDKEVGELVIEIERCCPICQATDEKVDEMWVKVFDPITGECRRCGTKTDLSWQEYRQAEGKHEHQ